MKEGTSRPLWIFWALILASCSRDTPITPEPPIGTGPIKPVPDLPKVISTDFNLINLPINLTHSGYVEVEFFIQFDSAYVNFPIRKVVITDGTDTYTDSGFGASPYSSRWMANNSVVLVYHPKSEDEDSVRLGTYHISLYGEDFQLDSIPIKVWARNDSNATGGYAYSQRTGKDPVPFRSPIIDSVRFIAPGLLLDSVKVYFTNVDSLVGRGVSVSVANGTVMNGISIFKNQEKIFGTFPPGPNVVSFRYAYDNNTFYFLSIFSRVEGTRDSDYHSAFNELIRKN